MAKVFKNTKDMDRQEWLEARRAGIGGSDIAGIMGMSPWSSPIKVYQEKIGELPEAKETEPMYWGNILEDIVAKEFQKRTGLQVRRRNAMLQDEENPEFMANVDRLVVGRNEGLECKTTNSFSKGDWGDGVMPEQYYLQCQWYMAVTGYDKWHIAVLIGNTDFHMDVIKRDDELIEIMKKRAKTFWNDHVFKEDPPEFDGSRASDELLKYLYPEGDEEQHVQLENSFVEELERRDELKEQEKEIKKEVKDIENRIKARMEEAENAEAGPRKITWKTVYSNRLDSKKLREDNPEIAEKYTTQSTSRRFTVK